MSKFAKLFEINDRDQVLVTVGENNDEDKFELVQRTDIDGLVLQMAIGFKTEEAMDAALVDYNLDNAQKFYEAVKTLLK